jgi:Tetratricopeptide repeat
MASSAHAPSTTLGPGTGAVGGGWLYGPSTDLLLGAGLGYVVSIPLLALLSGFAGLRDWPVLVPILLSLLISGSHYGATILRVYEHRHDRRKYAFFAVWTTVALCVLFVAGANNILIGSILVTLYTLWSPWHFSGQNYGVALMFLRRRGVVVEPAAKRGLYLSFVLSFVLWLFILIGQRYVAPGVVASVNLPGASSMVYHFPEFRVPPSVLEIAVPLLALAYVLSLAATGALLLRNARSARDLAPAAGLVVVQLLWFSLPAVLRMMGNFPLNGLAFTAIWVSAAHGLQYLWVTSYYAKREDPSHRIGSYLARALLTGSTVTILPGLLAAPGLLGSVPWDLGLGILLVSVVNLHHFVLDGAIWKLRDGRVARLLLKDASTLPASDPLQAARSTRLRWAMAVLGVLALSIAGSDVWLREFVVGRAGEDLPRKAQGLERLAWIGRDSPAEHTRLAWQLVHRDEPEAALTEFQRSVALYPTKEAWGGIGYLHASHERWSEASEAFAAVLAEDPDNVRALVNSSRVAIRLGRPDQARAALEHARTLAPRNAAIGQLLRELPSQTSTAEREGS